MWHKITRFSRSCWQVKRKVTQHFLCPKIAWKRIKLNLKLLVLFSISPWGPCWQSCVLEIVQVHIYIYWEFWMSQVICERHKWVEVGINEIRVLITNETYGSYWWEFCLSDEYPWIANFLLYLVFYSQKPRVDALKARQWAWPRLICSPWSE
jgi:hypothetical protein